MDHVLKEEFHLKYKNTDIWFLHPWGKVDKITIVKSFNLNGTTLRIVGKELNPKNATSNVPRVHSLDDDIKRTKPYIANESSK